MCTAVVAQDHVKQNKMENDTTFYPENPEVIVYSFDLDRHDLNKSFVILG